MNSALSPIPKILDPGTCTDDGHTHGAGRGDRGPHGGEEAGAFERNASIWAGVAPGVSSRGAACVSVPP